MLSESERQIPPTDELAALALRQIVAGLADRLHDAIDAGLDADTLHNIVGLWEANNLNEELTYEALVAAGTPTTCDDCVKEVTPYDEYGRPVEGGWEWYMVRSEIWEAAGHGRKPPRILCIGCLEARIGRRLTPEDFSDLEINRAGWTSTERLIDRLGVA
jgi:hypothetical protein